MAAFMVRCQFILRPRGWMMSEWRWRLNRGVSQMAWEDLLGRKIDPAAAQKLELLLVEYKTLKWRPSWLPLLPQSSYWLPSQEDTVKEIRSILKNSQVLEQQNYCFPTSPTAWNNKTRPSVTTLPWFETASFIDKDCFVIAEEEVSDMEDGEEEKDSDDENAS